MFTPASTARTAPGPAGAASGSSTSTAGRLLMRLASAAPSAAVASSAGSEVPSGTSGPRARSRPLVTTAWTTTPSPSTNTRKGTAADRPTAVTVVRRWARARAARTAAPANAAQAGLIPAADVATNPARVAPTVTSTKTGVPAGRTAGGSWAPAPRSAAKNRVRTRYSV